MNVSLTMNSDKWGLLLGQIGVRPGAREGSSR